MVEQSHPPLRTLRSSHSIITRHQAIGRWFHNKEHNRIKEKARVEKARVHAAGVAAAVAADASADNQTPKMVAALASATKLVASHCIEIAELAGANHEQVASAVESAVDVRTPSDLMTLTAATALRGAAAMKLRIQREGRSNAVVIPYEKGPCWSSNIWCKEGELLKRTRNCTAFT